MGQSFSTNFAWSPCWVILRVLCFSLVVICYCYKVWNIFTFVFVFFLHLALFEILKCHINLFGLYAYLLWYIHKYEFEIILWLYDENILQTNIIHFIVEESYRWYWYDCIKGLIKLLLFNFSYTTSINNIKEIFKVFFLFIWNIVEKLYKDNILIISNISRFI